MSGTPAWEPRAWPLDAAAATTPPFFNSANLTEIDLVNGLHGRAGGQNGADVAVRN